MESMGREQFETHGAGNDQLGLLEPELRDALLFRKGICIGSGTFPALEGILFDTPLTPLTQTVYGRKPLSVSRIRAYRDAGYRTIFLTSGPEGWRSIAETFPIQGFDAVYGAAALSTRYPQAESGTWGVGDEWMFRYALELLDEADRKGEKLFLVLLSTTNHPPHRVPDGAEVPPVDPARLPVYVRQKSPEDTRAMQQTYRYAANALGRFVRNLRTRWWRQRATTTRVLRTTPTAIGFARWVSPSSSGFPKASFPPKRADRSRQTARSDTATFSRP